MWEIQFLRHICALTLYNLCRKGELDWNVQCTLNLVTKKPVTKSHNVNDFM